MAPATHTTLRPLQHGTKGRDYPVDKRPALSPISRGPTLASLSVPLLVALVMPFVVLRTTDVSRGRAGGLAARAGGRTNHEPRLPFGMLQPERVLSERYRGSGLPDGTT